MSKMIDGDDHKRKLRNIYAKQRELRQGFKIKLHPVLSLYKTRIMF